MPFVSKAQRRFFEANRGKLEAQGVDVTAWERETGNKLLPERVGKTREQKSITKLQRGMQGKKR